MGALSAGASARPDLRLVPPPDQHAPPLGLAVGDLVVYASHGIGRIESVQPVDGLLLERIILVFESGLKVTLPLARARDALRRVSGEPELGDVQRTLCTDEFPSLEPWSRRHRLAQQKLAAGRVGGLAEIVRDGLQRERRLASGPSGRSAAPSDNEVYRQARRLLAAEIAACRGIEPETADAWILQQVSGAPRPGEDARSSEPRSTTRTGS
jgi:RNA polymerase-interacting CarD/CdnL/TRCF family regulator